MAGTSKKGDLLILVGGAWKRKHFEPCEATISIDVNTKLRIENNLPRAPFSFSLSNHKECWLLSASSEHERQAWVAQILETSATAVEESLKDCGHEIEAKELEIFADQQIGKGGFGIVKKGILKGSRREVAVKMLYNLPEFTDPEEIERFLKEMQISIYLRHPNVVTMLGYCKFSNNFIALVTEYMSNGDLTAHIYTKSLSLNTKLKIALNLACGMVYLHSSGVIHRDLKPHNILVGDLESGQVKVCDFGLARATKGSALSRSITKNILGSPAYSAPELSVTHTKKVDVYSYALILWELMNQKKVWLEKQFSHHILDAVSRGERPGIEQLGQLTRLVTWCWQADPKKRPSFATVHEYLQFIMLSPNEGEYRETYEERGAPDMDSLLLENSSKSRSNANPGAMFSFSPSLWWCSSLTREGAELLLARGGYNDSFLIRKNSEGKFFASIFGGGVVRHQEIYVSNDAEGHQQFSVGESGARFRSLRELVFTQFQHLLPVGLLSPVNDTTSREPSVSSPPGVGSSPTSGKEKRVQLKNDARDAKQENKESKHRTKQPSASSFISRSTTSPSPATSASPSSSPSSSPVSFSSSSSSTKMKPGGFRRLGSFLGQKVNSALNPFDPFSFYKDWQRPVKPPPQSSRQHALHLAAERGNTESIDLLLQTGVSVEAVSEFGWTALHVAVFYGRPEIVQFLCERKADLNAVTQDDLKATPLHIAVHKGKMHMIPLLLSLGADPTITDGNRYTPLHLAAAMGREQCTQELLAAAHTSSSYATSRDISPPPIPPAHVAVLSRSLECLSLLYTSPGVTDPAGWLPMHVAFYRGDLHVICALLEASPSRVQALRSKTNTGDLPIHLCVRAGHDHVLPLALQEDPSLLNVQGEKGNTPLHVAAKFSHAEIVKLLLSYEGIDTKIVNSSGKTAHRLAVKYKDEVIAAYLVAFESSPQLFQHTRPGERIAST